MDFPDLFMRLGVALGVGLLIGLERGWRTRDEKPGSRTAGIRTFALSALLGSVFAALSQQLPDPGAAAGIVLGLAFVAFAAIFALFSRDENLADGRFSVTTAVAGMMTFALGAYAALGDIRLAAAGGVATAGILAAREDLHGWVARITEAELRAGLLLLAMTVIVLPLLPNDDIGPFGGVNPREIWLIAIVLAAVSFLGYAAVKVMGATRGVLLSAAAGGLVSSTAVMVTSARQAAAGEGAPRILAAGAMLAAAISIVRTIVIVGVLNQAMIRAVLLPLGAAALAAAATALVLASRGQSAPVPQEGTSLRNPFELKSVLGFAAFLGIMEVVARALAQQFGAAGAVVAALAAGVGDVDAVTVSMTKLAPATLPVEYAALAVLAAVASNTLSKLGIGLVVGRGRFAAAVTAATGVAFLAAALGWMAARWLGVAI